MSGLITSQEAGDTYVPVLGTPAVPAAFKDRVGTPELTVDGYEYRATLPLRGDWHGLPLRSVVIVGWIESEQGFEVVFDVDSARVLATANRAGFAIPSSGSEYRNEDVLGLNVGVAEHDGGASLFCMPG